MELNIPLDPSADKIPNEMYEAISKDRSAQKPRRYLGMSAIGDSCDRKLWYSFRSYNPIPIDGRVLLIFELGDHVEGIVEKWLHKAGYILEGLQDEFKDINGYFRGHCDGYIKGVTNDTHVLEIKSANDKKFKLFKKNGVRATYPQYYVQVQCYMGYAVLKRALVVVYNKNTSEIYTERIPFVESDFQIIRDRAFRIIYANDIPDRPFKQNSTDCKWCDFKLHCWHPESTPITTQVCGTCDSLIIKDEEMCCNNINHKFALTEWGIGCPDWIPHVQTETPTGIQC